MACEDSHDILQLSQLDHNVSAPHDEDLFSMTALPSSPTQTRTNVDEDENIAEDEFFEDIGYKKLVTECNALGAVGDDALAELKAKAEQCKQLQKNVQALKADLDQLQEENATARRQDEAKQKESDDKMEAIRKMEEDTATITNSIPMKEEEIRKIEGENDDIKRKIAAGSGWTETQTQERARLTQAIDDRRSQVESLSTLSNT